MATRKYDSETVPSWQDGYKLEDGTPLGISHSLWDEISGHEANAASIYSGTPVSQVPEVSPMFYSPCSQESMIPGCSGDASLDVTGSPRPKRRRMLEYPDTCSAYKSDFQQIEFQVESSQESTFTSAPQVYGYPSSTSSSPYSYPHAGAGHSSVTASTVEQSWLTRCALNSPHQQMVSGEIFQQGNAWFEQFHRHTPLHEDVPKFPNDEIDHCEFLAERPWVDQDVHLGQTDRRSAAGDVNYPHMNPVFVSPLHSPGFQIFGEGPVCDDKRVTGVRTPLPGTPGSNIAIQHKPQPVTPLPLCPFDVVKPLPGVEGNMTLEDINQRISTSLPVHHFGSSDRNGSALPEDRSRPTSSETGIGLSGKSVVSLRTIHTQGSGTLTIIRTKD